MQVQQSFERPGRTARPALGVEPKRRVAAGITPDMKRI